MDLLVYLLGSKWGQVILTIGVIALVVGCYVYLQEDRLFIRNRRVLKSLSKNWGFFQWKTIEWQIRSAAEAWFHGWNTGDLSEFEKHATPECYEEISELLRNDIQDNVHKKLKIDGLIRVEPTTVQTPNESRLSMVVGLLKFTIPAVLSTAGVKEDRYLMLMVHDTNGDWKCSGIIWVERYESLKNLIITDAETEWLHQNIQSSPSQETTRLTAPHRVLVERRNPLRIFGSIILIAVGILCGGASHSGKQDYEKKAVLRKTGETAFAKIVKFQESESGPQVYASYQFEINGDSAAYTSSGGMLVEISRKAFKEAKENGQLKVAYEPADPTNNTPFRAPPYDGERLKGLWIGAFFFCAIGILIFPFSLKPGANSIFWDSWKESEILF